MTSQNRGQVKSKSNLIETIFSLPKSDYGQLFDQVGHG